MSERYKLRLKEMNIDPKKSLGQNFLVNEEAIARIIRAANLKPNLKVIEIGPGLGALTEELINKDLDLTLIEFDFKLAEYWSQRNQNVISKDALKLNWKEFLSQEQMTLVSNLPYNISSSLVVELSQIDNTFNSMVLMFQKEVAQRISAKPQTKNYGILSVMSQVRWDCKKIIDLSPKSFYPSPKVSSRVLVFRKKENLEIDFKKFCSFVKKSFFHRRKTLAHNLVGYRDLTHKKQVQEVIESIGSKTLSRAEELSVDDFVLLFKKLIK